MSHSSVAALFLLFAAARGQPPLSKCSSDECPPTEVGYSYACLMVDGDKICLLQGPDVETRLAERAEMKSTAEPTPAPPRYIEDDEDVMLSGMRKMNNTTEILLFVHVMCVLVVFAWQALKTARKFAASALSYLKRLRWMTRLTLYTSTEMNSNGLGTCLLCCEEDVPLHAFIHGDTGHIASCRACVKTWRGKNNRCPVCNEDASYTVLVSGAE